MGYIMKTSKTLRDLEPGNTAVVVKISGASPIQRRILEMGVVKGAVVEVLRVAPLGDPVEIKIKGSYLSIRKKDAENIIVEVNDA